MNIKTSDLTSANSPVTPVADHDNNNIRCRQVTNDELKNHINDESLANNIYHEDDDNVYCGCGILSRVACVVETVVLVVVSATVATGLVALGMYIGKMQSLPKL